MILHYQTHPVKSGKSWLYATSVLLILGGGIALANPSVAYAATNTNAFVRKEAPKKVENDAVAHQRVATFSTAVNSVGDNIATGSITGTLEYGDWSGSDLTTDLENGDAYLSINDESGNELQDIELMGTVSGTTFSGTYSESATSASDYNYGIVTGKQSADGFWTFNFIQSFAVKAVATGSITESLSDPSYTFNGQVSDGKNFDSVWFIDADGYGVNLDGAVSGDTFTGTYEWNTYDENTGSNVNYIGTVTGTLSNGTWTFNFGQKKSMLPATFSGVISGSTSTGWTVDYSNNDNSFTDGTSFSSADVYNEFGNDGDYWLNGTTTGTTFSGMYSTYDSDGNGIVAGDVTGTLSSGKWAFKFTKTSYSATGLITGTLSNPYFWDGNGNATSSTAASEMEFVDSSGDTIDLEGSTVNNKFTGTYTNESTGVTNNVTGTYSSGKWTFNFGNYTAPTILYNAQVQKIGWQKSQNDQTQWFKDGQEAGTNGKSLRMETLKIALKLPKGLTGGVEYDIHVQKIGWQNAASPTKATKTPQSIVPETQWFTNGAAAGTVGKGLRMEAFTVKLTGQIAKYYDVVYDSHVQNIGWQYSNHALTWKSSSPETVAPQADWFKNGQEVGTNGKSLRMEALEIKLVPKSATAQSQVAALEAAAQ
ncbi:hypothetical protein [Lactococcus protaetiae]|uniref:GH16 domain-containing protein n=1 Tax=Lactococcus protaetiae TaxID=2592653 RepID=A0A514Z7H2_9LACT|nr:hypothetical protein [Lactococcus protaetiae]QDK70503.1 hypothetical protein FLP15_04080 [Lactococcus protaetiae]